MTFFTMNNSNTHIPRYSMNKFLRFSTLSLWFTEAAVWGLKKFCTRLDR